MHGEVGVVLSEAHHLLRNLANDQPPSTVLALFNIAIVGIVSNRRRALLHFYG